jgi:hypothetical protein
MLDDKKVDIKHSSFLQVVSRNLNVKSISLLKACRDGGV